MVAKIGLLCLMPLAALLTGCGQRQVFGECDWRLRTGECREFHSARVADADLDRAGAEAVDALLRHLIAPLPKARKLGVVSLANLDDLEHSSALGRLLSEQIATRFTQLGYPVVEIRQRNALAMREREGEFMLSREVGELLSREHALNTLCVGTYSMGANRVYLVLKLLRPSDGLTLAAHSFSLPLGANARALLHGID